MPTKTTITDHSTSTGMTKIKRTANSLGSLPLGQVSHHIMWIIKQLRNEELRLPPTVTRGAILEESLQMIVVPAGILTTTTGDSGPVSPS